MIAFDYYICSIFLCSVLAVFAKSQSKLHDILILISSSVSAVFLFQIWNEYLSANQGFVFINTFGAKWLLEPIALIFVTMVTVLWICNNIYSISYLSLNRAVSKKRIYFFMSISVALTVMIGFSSNLIHSYIFYELLTIFTYPLVAGNLTEKEKRSSKFYILFLLATSMLIFLPSILYLYQQIGTANYTLHPNFVIDNIWLVGLMVIFGVSKSAIVPMHFWLPRAMIAPVPVSALLHAVAVVKSGVFLILKIFVYFIGIENLSLIPGYLGTNIITVVISFSLIISSVVAIYQTNLKKLLAYSTINQLSLCIFSLSLFSKLGVIATVLHMLSHAFAKITLFFATGNIQTMTGKIMINDMRSLSKKMPVTCGLFIVSSMSIIGIPVFAGFISKSYMLFAAFDDQTDYFFIILLAVSILFTANYFVRIIYKFYIQDPTSSSLHLKKEKLLSTMTLSIIITSTLVISMCFFYNDIIKLLSRVL